MEERMSYSKTVDGVTKSAEVRKVKNGYVMRVTEYGKNGEDYIDKTEEYISKTNPLMKEEEKIETPLEAQKKVYDLLDGFF